MSEESLTAGEYPVWSPYDAHEAATILLQLLEQEQVEAVQIRGSAGRSDPQPSIRFTG